MVRLAADPVAGADFFQFCVMRIFSNLFEWDFDKHCPARKGILGQIKVFFGSDKFTNRGQLYGHFVIWLDGAPNPSVIHKNLQINESYCERFFSFFDNILKHDLPTVECSELLNSNYEPRTEQLILPPDIADPNKFDEPSGYNNGKGVRYNTNYFALEDPIVLVNWRKNAVPKPNIDFFYAHEEMAFEGWIYTMLKKLNKPQFREFVFMDQDGKLHGGNERPSKMEFTIARFQKDLALLDTEATQPLPVDAGSRQWYI